MTMLTKQVQHTVLLSSMVLLYTVMAFWLAGLREDYFEDRIRQDLVAELEDFASAIKRNTIIQWGNAGYDTSLPVYNRLNRQLSNYQKLTLERGYFGLVKKGDNFHVAIGANPHSKLKAGDIFQLESHAMDKVFNQQKPLVMGPVAGKNPQTIITLLPYVNTWNGETLMLIGMEQQSDTIRKASRQARQEVLLIFLVFGVLLLGGHLAITYRNQSTQKIQGRLRHLETVIVFLTGLLATFVIWHIVSVLNSREQKQFFQQQADMHATALQKSLYGLRDNVKTLSGFFTYSDFVDPYEWDQFAGLFDETSFQYTYGFAPLLHANATSPNPYGDYNAEQANKCSKSTSGLYGLDVGYHLPVRYLSQNRLVDQVFPSDLCYLDAIHQAMAGNIADKEVFGTTNLGFHGADTTGQLVLVLAPAFQKEEAADQSGQQIPVGFSFGLVDMQHNLDAIASLSDMHPGLAIGLVDAATGNRLIASFPKGHQHESFDCYGEHFSANSAYHHIRPLFLWGNAYGIVTHSIDKHESVHGQINRWLVGIGGIVATLLLTIMVWFLRNRWARLSGLIKRRTADLNQRLKEMDCLLLINQEMQKELSSASLGKAIVELLAGTIIDDGIIQLEMEGETFVSDTLSSSYIHSTDTVIMLMGKKAGNIGLFKTTDNFKQEEKQLLQQVALSLGRWLDRHHMEVALRKSEEQFRQLVENAFDAIYLMEDRHYSYVNSRFVEMTGYSEAELYDKDFRFDALLTARSRLVAEQRYRARQNGEVVPAQYETQIQSKTGEVHDVEVSTVSIGTADKVLVMGIIRNITERKQAQTILKRNEHELQLKNEELQSLNEELTETNERMRLMNVQLKKAKEMAEAGDKLKTAFLNNISHEVRTPLNGILGATALIADPGASQDDRNDMMEIISISTQRLLRTITQYMDISLLSSNNMAIYPGQHRLENLLMPFLEEYAKACEMKELAFEIELPEKHATYVVETDKSLVEKVLHHLLENAVKFTKTGYVRFGYTFQEGEFRFFVADTGIGIDPAVHDKIFTEFTQEDSSNLRRYEGSGLGLAICKHSLELLQGRIWFETVKGKGTVFWFTIPASSQPVAAKPPEKVVERETAAVPKLILYAEDEDSNFQVLNMLLRKKTNAHIIRAEDGQKAVDLCQTNPDIDLVLMDIKMPIMDGYEATRLIKAMRPELPIVAITAYGLSGDENKALRAGCNDYIAKPVGKDDMLKMVAKYGVELKK